jgi:hypothetical protein
MPLENLTTNYSKEYLLHDYCAREVVTMITTLESHEVGPVGPTS